MVPLGDAIISENTEPIFTKFSELVDMWMEMINPSFVLRLLKGRCYSNQFCGESAKISIGVPHPLLSQWCSETDWKIATLM